MTKHPTPKARAWVVSAALLGVVACVDSAPIFSEMNGAPSGGSDPGDSGGSGGAGDGGSNMAGSGGRTGSGNGGDGSGAASTGGGDNWGGAGSSPGPTGDRLVVDAGDTHSCGIVDGALYCWGDNDDGALGLGDESSRPVPVRLENDLGWRLVQCGGGFTCAATSEEAYCFGDNSSGQLGTGRFDSRNEPALVALAAPVSHLSAGHHHVCAVLEDGTLWCWGNNTEGQLGQDDPFPDPGVNKAVPVQVGDRSDWAAVSGGDGHTCAIRSSGQLYCWGRNTLGELGLGPETPGQIRVPQLVGTRSDWALVAAGQNHTCAVRRDGTLWCWGGNSSGQLGLPDEGPYFEPTLIPNAEEVVEIATNTFHTCALNSKMNIHCYGRNAEGQLGDGTIEDARQGTTVLPEGPWNAVATGRFHTCAVGDGAFFCTGENKEGRLGTSDRERRSVLTATQFFEGR